MGTPLPYPWLGYVGPLRKGMTGFVHKVITSTGGDVAATSDGVADSGLTVVKTATKTGRYTITLPKAYRKFCGGFVTIIGPDDAEYAAAGTAGYGWIFRDNDIDGGAGDGTINLQFLADDDFDDAELPDATVFIIHLFAAQGI